MRRSTPAATPPRELGLRWGELDVLRDVDGIADALEVARAIPASRFARVMAEIGQIGDPGL